MLPVFICYRQADGKAVAERVFSALDGQTGQQIAVLKGHDRPVWHAVLSGDGNRVVTASADSTARLWDGQTGQQLAVLSGHKGQVNHAAFNSDGTRIITASADRTARLWKTYPTYDALYAAGAEFVKRLQPLTTTEECQYYLRTEGCGSNN